MDFANENIEILQSIHRETVHLKENENVEENDQAYEVEFMDSRTSQVVKNMVDFDKEPIPTPEESKSQQATSRPGRFQQTKEAVDNSDQVLGNLNSAANGKRGNSKG